MPDEKEMEIIWQVVTNLGWEDMNRVYYKNKLYEFMLNSKMSSMITMIVNKLNSPFNSPTNIPEEIKDDLIEFTAILKEYVYYGYMYIDRIDRCDNMIKDICMISDTDSTIISLDAWFRFSEKLIDYNTLKIHRYPPYNPIFEIKKDEFGDIINKEDLNPAKEIELDYDYDFQYDKLIELKHSINPIITYSEDYVRYSLINIMCYVLDHLVNDYMERMTKGNYSYDPNTHKCRIVAKNEFLMSRVLLHTAQKSYASIMELQEGNMIPKDKRLDVKGIASMAKSSMSKSTRDALKKILYEDVLTAPAIDQFRIIKDIAVLEKKIYNNIMNGDKKYYKPLKIKSANSYENPMRMQGVKASVAWNELKPKDDGLPMINLEERNIIDVAKVNIDKNTVDKLKDKFPEVYENALRLMQNENFKKSIDAIAIPNDTVPPEWVLEMIDYKDIINNNISGFTYESIGISRLNRNSINYTNILQI
jgi:hypothetical protein